MRRFDKKNNIKKVNLLSEQRYLESKGLLNENELDDHSMAARNSQGYPIQLQHDDPTIGKENQRINNMSKEQFKTKFEQLYTKEPIQTTDGIYFFDVIKFNSNYGSYRLLFVKPQDDTNLNKTLWFDYDPTTGYVMSKEDIELLGDSKNKIIEMLKYNK